MSLELDHVFICVEEKATAEQALVDFGFRFDLRALHGGQGTANACAFFDNAYFELLWRHDERDRGESLETPIDTWPYEAAFLPPGKNIPIVTKPGIADEPLVFLIPGHLLELEWDGGGSGKSHDFRPTLPLILRWWTQSSELTTA